MALPSTPCSTSVRLRTRVDSTISNPLNHRDPLFAATKPSNAERQRQCQGDNRKSHENGSRVLSERCLGYLTNLRSPRYKESDCACKANSADGQVSLRCATRTIYLVHLVLHDLIAFWCRSRVNDNFRCHQGKLTCKGSAEGRLSFTFGRSWSIRNRSTRMRYNEATLAQVTNRP